MALRETTAAPGPLSSSSGARLPSRPPLTPPPPCSPEHIDRGVSVSMTLIIASISVSLLSISCSHPLPFDLPIFSSPPTLSNSLRSPLSPASPPSLQLSSISPVSPSSFVSSVSSDRKPSRSIRFLFFSSGKPSSSVSFPFTPLQVEVSSPILLTIHRMSRSFPIL